MNIKDQKVLRVLERVAYWGYLTGSLNFNERDEDTPLSVFDGLKMIKQLEQVD